MSLTPPKALKKPHVHEIHGDKRTDDFFWMRNRDSAEVLEHLKEENAYADQVLKPTEELQKELFEEMKGRIKKDDNSVPYLKKGYYYYIRFESDGEYPIYCRKRDNLEQPEEILLDVNQMAAGHSYYDLRNVQVSPDNKLVSFALDLQGRRKFTVRFRELASGKDLDVEIPDTTGNYTWANEEYLFYSHQNPETLRYESIYRFSFKDRQGEQIYFEEDETFGVYVHKSLTRDFLFISAGNKITSEIQYLKADQPLGQWQVFEKREKGHEYSVDHAGGDNFYVLTNWEAENFRLMETTLSETGRKAWKEVLAHDSEVLLEHMEVFEGHVALSERYQGLTQLRLFNRKTKALERLSFPEKAYHVGMGANEEYSTKTFRYHYESPKTPPSTYDFQLETKTHELRKQKEVLGGFDKVDYQVEWIMVEARDGAKVPVSMVYHKDTPRDGSAPLLQYGYGSYGISMDPHFSASFLSLLNRGFIFATAHIRGGSEMGRHWYEKGKYLQKMNTFNDFIDCSEYLIEKKYTSKERLVIMGGSAGGLLMGSVINLRPDLYKSVISIVPFVDVVTTMLDESLPLTTGEYEEWGNPNDPEYYHYMKSYSPIDNVKPQAYPHHLITTGYHDSQVQYWEPAKWVARLRECNTSDSFIVFKTDMESGHSGTTGRFKSLELTALHFAFAIYTAGL